MEAKVPSNTTAGHRCGVMTGPEIEFLAESIFKVRSAEEVLKTPDLLGPGEILESLGAQGRSPIVDWTKNKASSLAVVGINKTKKPPSRHSIMARKLPLATRGM